MHFSPHCLLLGVLNALKDGFQPGCLWSGLRLPLLYLRIILPPVLYLRIICLPGWAFALSSNHFASRALFSNRLSPRLGASGRVSGCHCFIFESFCLPCFIFESFVSQAGFFWSGLLLPLLYLRIMCLPAWVPLVGSPAAFALSSNHLSPSLGASGRVSGCLCFIFESFVSHPACLWSGLRLPLLYLRLICFQPGCPWSGLRLPLLYLRIVLLPVFFLRIICLPASVPLVGSPAAFALSSNHFASRALSANHLCPRLGASGRVSSCFPFMCLRCPCSFVVNHHLSCLP